VFAHGNIPGNSMRNGKRVRERGENHNFDVKWKGRTTSADRQEGRTTRCILWHKVGSPGHGHGLLTVAHQIASRRCRKLNNFV